MERAFLPLAIVETSASFVVTSVRHSHVSRCPIYLYAAEKARWIADLSLCSALHTQVHFAVLYFSVILSHYSKKNVLVTRVTSPK